MVLLRKIKRRVGNSLLLQKTLDMIFSNRVSEVEKNWHEDFICHLIAIHKPKTYVELGIYKADLYRRVSKLVNKAFGVDISQECFEFVKDIPNSTFYCGSTDQFAKTFEVGGVNHGTMIDFLFIDADHSKEAVIKDFNNFFPFVKDNGLILFHDTYPADLQETSSGYCGDGYKAIENLVSETKDYEMMTIPVAPGLTICRKRSKHLAWMQANS